MKTAPAPPLPPGALSWFARGAERPVEAGDHPLVSPDLLGVSAGAALGAILGIVLSLPVVLIQGFAFAGGLAAVALVYLVASSVRGHDPMLLLVLAGIAVGALLSAGISLLKVLADPYDQLPAITYWLLGGSATATPDHALFSTAGTVGWVGLLVPHMARMLVGPDFSRLLPASLFLGAAFLLAVDTLARTMAAVEVPLGILTAVPGAPFLLWLMARGRRRWS